MLIISLNKIPTTFFHIPIGKQALTVQDSQGSECMHLSSKFFPNSSKVRQPKNLLNILLSNIFKYLTINQRKFHLRYLPVGM